MKILTVVHDKNYVGGANRSLLMVLQNLRDVYHVECDVLVPGHGTMEDVLKKHNFNVIVSHYQNPFSVGKGTLKDIPRKINVHIKFFREWNLGRKLAVKFAQSGYQLVYTNTRYPVVGAVIANKLHIPHVCHIREFGSAFNYQGLWTYKAIYRYSQRVILISKALYDRMARDTPTENLVMIHNGISGDIGLITHELFPDGRFELLLTGRITAEKGQMDAVLAVKKLVEHGINVHLSLAGSVAEGDRAYLSNIQKLIHEQQIENNVTFLGEVSDMKELRASMDIELMCAICETFGRVTVEGMRNGLLVIGSNTGGTVEIIQDGVNGLLYQQGNPNHLAKQLEKVYKDPVYGRKLASNGYEFSQEHFTEKINATQIYQVIEDLIQANTCN